MGECGLDGITLEPEVDGDGFVVGELLVEVRQDGAEACRIRGQLVHVFDSMMAGVNSNQPGRYHLLLTTAGRPMQHGWWPVEATARAKFTTWIGSCSGLPEPRVTLVDEETGRVLATWPGEE